MLQIIKHVKWQFIKKLYQKNNCDSDKSNFNTNLPTNNQKTNKDKSYDDTNLPENGKEINDFHIEKFNINTNLPKMIINTKYKKKCL